MEEAIDKFIAALKESIAAGTFVKLSLANYKGTDEHLQKITARPIEIRKGSRILFQFRGKTSDRTKNFEALEAAEQIRVHLTDGFRSGHLFTAEKDFQLIIGKRSAKFRSGKPTFKPAETKAHDRAKYHIVDIHAPYLKALGITSEEGRVRSDQRDKWKQINKFVEILDQLYESSDLKGRPTLSMIDMGSGKGYLTFAAYDHFSRKLSGPQASGLRVTGVESRPHLVAFCNEIAGACGYAGLKFLKGDIAGIETPEADILIALHACDTATDDALYQAIAARASIIVAAPCCHKEVKRQLRSPSILAGILKHPVMLERTAETITDGLRSLLLEREGYRTKMFEFVSTEHTPKNNMLVAVRSEGIGEARRAALSKNIREIRKEFGIDHQRLATLINKDQ